ncbi:hypothetical protein HZS_6427 [Henneguya salminicola]|nr:hypothetical protein HZS_6427 [Henneguya salminicola]
MAREFCKMFAVISSFKKIIALSIDRTYINKKNLTTVHRTSQLLCGYFYRKISSCRSFSAIISHLIIESMRENRNWNPSN